MKEQICLYRATSLHHWSKSHLKEEARETKRDKERSKETDIRRIQTKSKLKEREK